MAENPTDAVNSSAEESLGSQGTDITPNQDGGIRKEILKQGSGDAHPGHGDTVYVHYVGTLLNGEKFDSSRDRGDKFNFKLGKGQVIKGWDIGVASMKRGELAKLICRAEYAYGENGSPPKIPPNATLIFEVELFDWKGEDLSKNKDEGILRSSLIKGEGYDTPKEDSTVEIHIVGRHNGRVFEDRDVSFIVGDGIEQGVVEGIETAVQSFKKNECSCLKIKSKYAYGKEGHIDFKIPSNADLEYEVTLKSFEKAKEAWEMETIEKLEQSEIFKSKGTDYFKAGKLGQAVRFYKKVVDFLSDEVNKGSGSASTSDSSDEEEEKPKDESDPELQLKISSLVLAGHLNLAMCQLKLGQNSEARDSCNQAIALKNDSDKAYFRRGQAECGLQNYAEAIADYKMVLSIDPSNKAAKNQITIVQSKIKQAKEKEKKLYAGMFEKLAAKSDDKVSNGLSEKKSESDENTSPQEPAIKV